MAIPSDGSGEKQPTPEEPQGSDLRLRDAVFFGGAVLLTSLNLANFYRAYTRDSAPQTQPIADALADVALRALQSSPPCNPPKPESIDRVAQLFEAPSNFIDGDSPDTENVTMHSQAQQFQDLYRLLGQPRASIGDWLNKADAAAGLYGIDIQLRDPQGGYDYGTRKADVHTLPQPQTQQTLTNIAKGLERLPAEYVEYAGVRRIILVRGSPEADALMAYVTLNPGKRNDQEIVVNVDNPPDPETILHELNHLTLDKECTDANQRDIDYIKLNGDQPSIYGDDKPSRHPDGISLESVEGYDWEKYPEMLRDAKSALEEGKLQRYCGILKQRLAKLERIVVRRNYGLTSVHEDQATVAEALYSPHTTASVLSPELPRIKSKFLYIMARLYEKLPHVVAYFADASSRPYYYMPEADCNQEKQPVETMDGRR